MATVYSLICFGGRSGKTVTMTIANPCVVSLTNHGLVDGTGVVFTTTGALPTGVTSGTTYYSRSTASGTFNLYDTAAHAIAGGTTGRVTTTGSQSGTHTIKSDYWVNTLDSTAKARYGSAGSERAYDSLSAWNTARTSAAVATDIEFCEVGMAWTDVVAAGLNINVPCAQTIIAPEVNGTKTSAWHGGAAGYGTGYILQSTSSAATTLGLGSISVTQGTNTTFRDMSVNNTNGGAGVAVAIGGYNNSLRRCFVYGSNNSGNNCGGIYVQGTGAKCLDNIVLRFRGSNTAFSWGIQYWQYAADGLFVAGNISADNIVGFQQSGGSAPGLGKVYNNIAYGNATNWGTAPAGSNVTGGYNAGESGNTPWGSTGNITNLVSGDFTTYNSAGNSYNFTPASTTSHQVDTGTLTVEQDVTDFTGLERPAYNNGGTETVDIGPSEKSLGYTRPVTRDLVLSGLVSGSQVVIFTTGTQTELQRNNSSSTSETYHAGVAGVTVDYTVMKAGYRPIRVTGVALDSTTTSVTIQQTVDRAYVASSGLTYTTNATVNTSTKIFSINTATTVQNWYSFLIEAWIAQSALANKAFPVAPNGPDSFSIDDGWEWRGWASSQTQGSGYSNTSLALLSRDGMRYTSSGTTTAQWAAILSVGVPTGMQARYQQVDGSGTTSAANTGNVDQLIQVYGNASYGNFDYRSFMVFKVQRYGYDEIEFDVVSNYGTLEDKFYVIGLAPVANGIADAAGITNLAITDHGMSPVTWHSKAFSLTITDQDDTHDGKEIIQWIRHNNNFNYHDLVQTNGDSYKTVRGHVYGDSGAALKGVRVVMADGTTEHPSFNRFTADDGTTYDITPVVRQKVTISGLVSGSRVQIYDTTSSTELFNDIVSGTSKVWTDTVDPVADRAIRVRIAYVSGAAAKTFIEAAIGTCGQTSGTEHVTYLASQTADSVYNTNAIDGPAIYATSGITFTDASPDRVNCNIAGGAVTYATIYACFVYWSFTSTGIANDFTYIDAPDTANYLLSGMKIRNTSATDLTVTGGWGRDATSQLSKDIIDTAGSTGNIFLAPDHVIPYSTGSGLTAGQAAQLTAVESATSLMTFNGSLVEVDVKKMNGATVNGTGQSGDKWRG